MSAVELLQPILDGGLQRNNFFNGRLLSAEDLRAEQDANRAQQRHLARATGDGVAWGLGVSLLSADPPRVAVTRGLALNRLGDILRLPADAEVTLIPDTTVAEATAGLFANCDSSIATSAIAPEGAYVLVVSPTSGYRGTALVSDPNTSAVGRGSCGARFTVEGIRFRLVPMSFTDVDGIGAKIAGRIPGLLPPDNVVEREQLRNLLAHACFGTEALREYFGDRLEPVGDTTTPAGWGALDAMRYRRHLTDCDVPLAIVVLKKTANMSFVDMWSVRRKLVDAGAIDGWRAVAGPRRVAEGEAAFLQFQTQLDVVKVESAWNTGTVDAKTYFDYLPAGGWLPTGAGGFNWRRFLGAHAPPDSRPVDAALLRGILERSWLDEPFASDTTPPVPVRVYSVPNETFVVFARSSDGNIRVVLSPPEVPSEKLEVAAKAKSGAVTRGTTRSGNTVPIPDVAPGPHEISVSATGYVPFTTQDVIVVGGRTIDVPVTLTLLPNGSILVQTIDTKGAVVAAVSVIATAGGVTRRGTQVTPGNYRIADLPNNSYTIKGTASGYKEATSALIGPIEPGTEKTATLVFEPSTAPKTKPPLCVAVPRIRRPALDRVRLCMVLAATEFEEEYYYGAWFSKAEKSGRSGTTFGVKERAESWTKSGSDRYASHTGQIVYTKPPWDRMVTLEPESTDVQQWLMDWAEWLAVELDDDQIAKAKPIVKLDPKYVVPTQPKEVPRTPPAYAVFGKFGVPLSIQPDHGRTPVPVRIDGDVMHGHSREIWERLCRMGICYLDELAWLWDEVMVDITRDPRELVREIIIDATKKVQEIINDRGYFPGVDKTLNGILKDAGLLDNVALANAVLNKLAALVGGKAIAMRLIMQAREIVPKDSWSLEGLKFTNDQMQSLNERGITSKGEFADFAATSEGRDVLAGALGIEGPDATRDAAVKELAGDALMGMVQGTVATGGKGTVMEMPSVSPTLGAKLAENDMGTVEALAAAAPEAVSEKANIPLDEAKELVAEAVTVSRGGQSVATVPGVTEEEAAAITQAVGVTTGTASIGTVVTKATAEMLAPALGGDLLRATSLLNGMKAGVQAPTEMMKPGMP